MPKNKWNKKKLYWKYEIWKYEKDAESNAVVGLRDTNVGIWLLERQTWRFKFSIEITIFHDISKTEGDRRTGLPEMESKLRNASDGI